VELEVHNAPPTPNALIPDEPIEMPEPGITSGDLLTPPEVPAHHRHWYDWLVKAFS
jgi:hypothetical protein